MIIYAQLHIKLYYDKNYTPLFLNIDDITFLNFHQNSRISDIHGKKLAQQQIKSFKVICRVSSLVYEFEFPNNMNIHSVILIIYLELVSKGSDFYNRFRNNYPISVEKNLWNNIEKN
jgi:hypothetical protein